MVQAPQVNRFLSSLSPEALKRLLLHATAVDLPVNTTLYKAEETPRHAYFLTAGIASVVMSMEDGGIAEVGIIGHEGVIGSMHLLGDGRDPTSCFMQTPGAALRIPFSGLQQAFLSSDEVRARVLEFVQQQSQALSQIASCNRLHEAEARLAHWLLMVQDRTQASVFGFTQEVLAVMLGAGRPTVAVAAGALQRNGLIEYHRGRMKIVDRKRLEHASCSCYQVTQQLYANLYKRSVVDRRGWQNAGAVPRAAVM